MDWRTQDYREHTIFADAHESTGTPGKWMANYIVTKDGADVARAAVANHFDSPDEARQNAVRIAKDQLDQLLDS